MNKADNPGLEQVKAEFEAVEVTSEGKVGDAYRSITSEQRTQSLARHDERISRLGGLQKALLMKFVAWLVFAGTLLAVAGHVAVRAYPSYYVEAPTELPMWMRQQQLLEQVSQVQQWLQEGQATSEMPPPSNMEELQAWLDQIELNPDLQSADSETGDSGPGFVPFQCSTYPVQCPVEDVPADSGDYRFELSRLVRNANIMLADNGDCAGTVNLIREYGSLYGWRRSEAVTKARAELSVARCFMDDADVDNAGVHYQRTFCASVADPNPDQAMNALYGLARIAYLAQDSSEVAARVECSENLLDYHLREETNIATLHHYVSLALMHYEFLDDPFEAIRLQEKALESTRALLAVAPPEQHDEHRSLMLTLQLNLMEGYITVNQTEPMIAMYEEVNQNPLLGETDRLVALGMLVMQDLIADNKARARSNLQEILRRYATLSEFSTLWSWDAFDRWQSETVDARPEKLDQQIREIRLALAPPRSAAAVGRLNQLLSEL